MAKIIFGVGVANITGKIGGSVFSRNKSGAYVRTNRKGTNPNTSRQQIARSKFASSSKYFSTLSGIQQQSFKDNAINYPQVDRLGNTVTLSGSQLASKFANILALADMSALPQELGSPVFVPTVNNVFVAGLAVGGEITALELSIPFSLEDGNQSTEIPENFKLIVSATRLRSNGFTAPKKADFKKIATLPAGTNMQDWEILAAYSAVYGSGVVGGDKKVFVSCVLVSLLTPQKTSPIFGMKVLN